ncbi:MAG TPA: molybdopterin cofactor-binding domain-containing protein [Bryobacteraceae bacterium]|nr:molybdopterin cofactor-binding domain-containing protein [Bryobacteraceae bacterium]
MNTQNITRIDVSRRGFLGAIFSAGALVLGAPLFVSEEALAAEVNPAKTPWFPTVYLGVQPNGDVIIVAHRSEMGTGIRTSLPMVAADELDVEWSRVRVEQALGDKKYGSQDTDGSNSIRSFYDPLRIAGATAKAMLIGAAAAKWSVPAGECKATKGFVTHGSSKASYGDLASSASHQPLPKPETLKFKSPAEYRYVGKGVPIVDLDDLVSGHGVFGMDAKMPGMVYASIEHPPVIGGELKSADDSETLQVRGVKQTVQIERFKGTYGFQPLGGVAVIADNTWAAMQGRKKLKVAWDLGPNANYDSDSFRAELTATARKPCKAVRNVGDVDAAFAAAAKTHEAEYYTPLLAHAPMEPPAAVAEFKNGKVEIWTATQNPQAVQDTVSQVLGIKPEDVACHVTLLGGAFGRKSKPDYAAEAALLSKKVGKPVKVVWSREDDVKFDYYHSTAAMYLKAAIDANGKPSAWLQRSVFPPIFSTFDSNTVYGDLEMGLGWNDVPFDIPNHRAENGPATAHVRIGWMRSVANVYHAFAVQSFLDELAAAANRDRVEYFLDVLGPARTIDLGPTAADTAEKYPLETARVRRVLETVADKSGWASKKSTPGHGYGIAVHRSFLTYVAAVVEVKVDAQGKVSIPRVDIALDTGKVINPDRVRSQFEGAAVFGTSIAMMGEITAKDGRIQQSNFNNYLVARMPEAPYETHIHIVNSDAPPAGVGEPGVPVMAPAIANAIFAATGKRIRELPIRKQKLV